MSYYNSSIEGSLNHSFRLVKPLDSEYICMANLSKTYNTHRLDSCFNKDRYRWYYRNYTHSYYRLDYMLYVFDMQIKYDCLEKFLLNLLKTKED